MFRSRPVKWHVLRACAYVLWLLAIGFLLAGVHSLLRGGLGHGLSGGGALLIFLLPAGFLFIFGMAFYSATRDEPRINRPGTHNVL
jgi:hypothetical protein